MDGIDLVDIANTWEVDYWRLWVEVSRYRNRCEALAHRKGPKPLIVPAAPFVRAVARERTFGRTETAWRGRMHRCSRAGYLTADAAVKWCDELGLRPELVWGRRWHALCALEAEGLLGGNAEPTTTEAAA
jgi:hypothetical protein